MAKRLLSGTLALVILLMCIIPTSVLAFDNAPEIQDVMSEEAYMELVLQMLVENQAYAETQFHDTEDRYPNTGYFGNGGPGKGQGIRGTNNYALLYAFLYNELPEGDYPSDGAYKQNLKEKAVKAIRYGLFTHNSVKIMKCTSNNGYWGPDDWQSSLHCNTLLFAAHLMWDFLDEQTREAAETVAVAEGDRAIRSNPRSYSPGNTGSEENAWDTCGPSIAYNMFPDHPHAEAWREAAIKFAMNTYSRKADANDSTIVDGKPASEWITTWNIFDDYSLENHGILHPTYQMSACVNFADSVVYYAYFDHEIPEAFYYNVDEVWNNVLKKLVYPTGEWIYPNGCDWTMVLPGNIIAMTYQSIMFQDPEAKLLETRMIQLARQRQLVSGDGRLVHISDIGVDREAVEMKRLMYSYLMHKYVGDWPEENTTWEEFIANNSETKTFLDGALVTQHNENRFAAFSWKNKYLGLITPNTNDDLADGYVAQPNLPNVVGGVTIAGTSGRTPGAYQNYIGEDSFSTIGVFQENSGKVERRIAMTALPDNAVVLMEEVVAKDDVTVTANNTFPLSFETDVLSGAHKTITTAAGSDAFDAGSGVNRTYSGDWVDVDGRTTVLMDQEREMAFGGYKVSSGIGGSTLTFGAETGTFAAGETISTATHIVYSNVGADGVQELRKHVTYLDTPAGWGGVLLRDTDGMDYYVFNRFSDGAESGEVELTGGTYGAPVLAQDSVITGNTARLVLSSGSMESLYGAVTKYVSLPEGKTLKATNSPDGDAFYLANDGTETVEAQVTFATEAGPVQGSVTLEPGATTRVILRDGAVAEEPQEGLPHQPAAPENVTLAADNGSIRVSWDSTATNVSEYIIERAEPYGTYTQVGTVDGQARQFTDETVAEVATYRYRVIAVDTEGYYRSEPGESAYLSIGNYVEDDGRVNLAQGKYAEMDLYEEAYPPSLALDGNTGTFCNNTEHADLSAANPSWFTVDLGASHEIDEVVLLPRVNYGPKDAKILVSTDGKTYTPVAENCKFANSQNVADNTVTFDPVEARYVRFEFASSYDSKGRGLAQIAEIRVYGTETAEVPDAPQDLTATALSDQAVKLTWTDAADDETGYTVERSKAGGAWETLAQLSPNTTAYVDASAQGGTSYAYRVAVVRDRFTVRSNEAAVETPSDPMSTNWAAGIQGDAVTVESTLEKGEYSKNFMTDGKLNTGWVTDRAAGDGITAEHPSWIQLDLGETRSIGRMKFYPYLPDTRLFGPKDIEIFTSVDGKSFQSAGKFTLPDVRDWSTVEFGPVDARYVKVVIYTGYDGGKDGKPVDPARNIHIRELEIYSVPDGSYLTGITVTPGDRLVLDAEAKTALTVTPQWSGAEAGGTLNVEYLGYDSSIIDVAADGTVTAKALGTTQIQVVGSCEGVYCAATIPVTVQSHVPVTGMTLEPEATDLVVGERCTVTASIQPENASEQKVIWTADGTFGCLELYEAGTTKPVAFGQPTLAREVEAVGLTRGEVVLTAATAESGSDVRAQAVITVRQATDVAPAAPENLAGTASLDGVALLWEDKADTETGFSVERKVRGGDWEQLALLPADTNLYTDQTAQQGQEYFYRVGAVNEYGTSYSRERILKMPVAVEGMTLDKTSVAVRKGFRETLQVTYTPESAWNQKVTWNVTEGADVVALYDAGTGAPVPLGTVSNFRTVEVLGSKEGTAVLTVTSAEDPTAVCTCEVTVLPGTPDVPQQVTAEATAPTTVKLTWAAQDDADSFVIRRSTDGTNWEDLAALDSAFTTYYDDTAEENTAYFYQVGTHNQYGTLYSDSVEVRTSASNLALGLTGDSVVVTSSEPSAPYHKDHLTDGDRTTPWASKSDADGGELEVSEEKPQVITIRLDQMETVNSVVICPNYVGDRFFGPKELDIQVSTDGEKYEPVLENVPIPERELVNTLAFDPVQAQYVRVVITAAWDKGSDGTVYDTARNVHLREVEIYGADDPFAGFQAALSSTQLTVGGTASLRVSDGKTASGAEVDLSSAEILYTYDPAVVSVDENGTVTAVGAGQSDITVTVVVDGVACKQTVSVEVTNPSAPSYAITVTQSEGGTISPSSTRVTRGSSKTFTIKAKDGYEIADVLVDGKSVGAVSSYTFENVKAKHTITAKFEKVEEITTVGGFTDVKSNDWFAEAVQYVVDEGLMNGTSETTFSPKGATTRGMIVTILYRQAGSPEVESDGKTWWSDARAWAMANGISDGTNMEKSITREQLATMLYRYAELMGEDVSKRADLEDFQDASKVSAYAVEALEWAAAEGIVTGKTGGILDPKDGATRAETATMFMRFAEQ